MNVTVFRASSGSCLPHSNGGQIVAARFFVMFDSGAETPELCFNLCRECAQKLSVELPTVMKRQKKAGER